MSSETDSDTADAQSSNQSNASTGTPVDPSETTEPDVSDAQPSSTEAETATDNTTPTTDQGSNADDQTETEPETEQPAQSFTASIEARHLKLVVNLTRAIVNEARLQLDATAGLSIRAVDPANVAMIDLTLPPDTFASFTTSGGVLGIDLDRLNSLLSLANVDDLVQFSLDTDTQKLTIRIDGLEYTLALTDPAVISPPPELPELDLPAHVQLEYETFSRALTAAEMVADHLTLRIEPDTEQFVAEASGDTDDMELVLNADDLSMVTVGLAKSNFSIDYLTEMETAIPANTPLDVTLGEDLPMILELDLDETATAKYLLAPRLTDDDM